MRVNYSPRKMSYPVRRMGAKPASAQPPAPEPEEPPVVAAPSWIEGFAIPAGEDINPGAGVQIGDLILVVCPYGFATFGGSDWERLEYTWWSFPYNAVAAWKVLTDVNDISVTGASYGCMYGVLRGATGLSLVEREQSSGTSMSLDFADTSPQLIVAHHQNATNPGDPAGFVEHFATQISSVFMMTMISDLEDATAGAKTLTGLPSALTHALAFKVLQ